MPALNNVQLEILKLFKYEKSEKDLLEIKKVLSDFLFNKAIKMADDVSEEKGYTVDDIESWKNEHFRLNNNADEGSN